jgi:hypothetical protein
MRSLRYTAVVVVVFALGLTSFALAGDSGPSTKQVAASFSTTSQHVTIKTCTGTDGTYTLTNGMYSGTVDGTLTGGATDTLQLNVRSLVNQATGDGSSTGQFTIKHGVTDIANGSLSAVDSASGSLSGFLSGHGPGTPAPPGGRARLFANFSATLTSGALNGQIGGNATMTNSAVEQSGGCPAPPEQPRHHEHPNPHSEAPSPHSNGH